eukprot:TRINITY_DN3338_c0_g1_i1.p1 TRINITY_DN3338_c0_g1~~TRINITY_DN3338_c0_g1_i1.p1  ORF type:complete len:107 (+),score=19.89 TRINITY_DN3338_c0_g1_i1:124-444(+)
MLRSLVGSEMCIRDRIHTQRPLYNMRALWICWVNDLRRKHWALLSNTLPTCVPHKSWNSSSSTPHTSKTCLLYTSDAADEEDSVDLGGRRIIKKKKYKQRKILLRE